MLDILLKNGNIIDGSGNPSYKSDIAIKDKQIVKIGRLDLDAREVLDIEMFSSPRIHGFS